jgi:hypothetical protein
VYALDLVVDADDQALFADAQHRSVVADADLDCLVSPAGQLSRKLRDQRKFAAGRATSRSLGHFS